jgi:hypothetical protein
MRAPLIAMTLVATLPVEAAERFYCDGNVTCTQERGCTGGDIPWTMNIWKEGDHWVAQDDLDGATPEIFTEISPELHPDGAIFLERVSVEVDRPAVQMLTILADRRMMLTWGFGEPRSGSGEYTLLSTCHEVE